MADINDYLEGLNYNLSAEEKQLMDIYAECWEHCRKGDCHNCEYRSGNKWCKMLLCMSYQYAKRLIAAGYSKCLLPAADVAQVVHGLLKHTGTLWSSMWICTNCNEIAYYPPHGNRKKRIIQPCGYNYCPNCGAKMDGEV